MSLRILLLTAYPLKIKQKEQKGQNDHDALGNVVVHQIELLGIVLDHLGQHARKIDEYCLQTVAAKFGDHIGKCNIEVL